MAVAKLLVYRRLASPAQIRTVSGVALIFLIIFVAAFGFRKDWISPGQHFVPITSALLIAGDCITGALLISQARILGAPPLHLLGVGYFLSALFLVLRILTLPGVVLPDGPSFDIPLWFYLTSHAMLPLGVMGYTWLNRSMDQQILYVSVGRYLAGWVILLGGLALIMIINDTALPTGSPTFLTACVVILLIISAMAMLSRALHSVLDFWLLLVLWGWLLETTLIALSAPGSSPAWYIARSLGLLSGFIVLFALLVETSRFYAQTVMQLEHQAQDREHRSLLRDAITASIAHELRQPLSAIQLSAYVSRNALGSDGRLSLPLDEMAEALDDILAQSKRATDIIESTRTIFNGARPRNKTRVDVGVMLQAALAAVAGNARIHDVLIKLSVEGQPKSVSVNQLQMQQALVNLFQNAIEAMARSRSSRRRLRVQYGPWAGPANHPEDHGVIIRVEDNGPGIPPGERERIFEVFYTTHANGTGMGLAIARAVIEAHGGTLTVEPRIPVGTVFVIHLPYSDGEEV